MAVATDFREYLRGDAPGDWTQRWVTTGATWKVRGMPFDAAHRNLLRLTVASGTTGFYGLTWDAPSGNDQEVLTQFRGMGATSGETARTFLRASGAAAAESAYYFGWDTSTTWRVWKVVAGAITSLASGTGPNINDCAHLWVWVRFQVVGTAIKARVWLDGDAEPGSWLISTTDSAVTTGAPGVGSNLAATFDAEWNFLSVSNAPNSASAVGLTGIARPMAEWSLDPSAKLDFSVEIESADRATNTVSTGWYSWHGRKTTLDDYPSQEDMDALVQSMSLPGRALAAESLFAGIAGSETSRLTLKNKAPGQTKAGQFDGATDRTYSGRRIVLRAGEAGQPHRAAEPVWAGVIKGEPVISHTEAVFELSGRAAWLDDAQMDVGHYVGIPTCLENLTIGAVRATTATNTAWDVTSLTLMLRMKMAADPATLANPIYRSASGTNQWVTVLYNTAYPSDVGKFAVQVALGGGAAVEIHKSPTRLDDAQWHDVIWSINDKIASYLMVDGEVVSEYTPASSMGTVTGTGLSCFVNWLAKVCDVRLYGCYLEPDEASALFAQRADPDDRCVGMWRLDDGLGSTAVDVSSGAKNMTIAGTENTNFLWTSTDLGDEGQAGQPMPMISGQVFGAEAQVCDVARSHMRYADQAVDGTVAVKLRGYEVDLATDYTDSAGVLDFVDTPAEPGTVDVADETALLGDLALAELVARVPAAVADDTVSVEHFEALNATAPWISGWAWNDAPKASEYLKQVVAGVGGYVSTDAWGRVAPSYLLPPINPGPYGLEPLLEFTGHINGGVTVAPSRISSIATASFAVSFWFKSWAPEFRWRASDDLTVYSYGPAAAQVVGADSRFVFGPSLFLGGSDTSVFGISGPSSLGTTSSPSGFFRHNNWYYVLLSYDTAASANGTIYLSAAALGDTALTSLSSLAVLGGAMNGSTLTPLIIGGGAAPGAESGFSGSVAYVSVYSAHKVAADVVAHLTARPTGAEANLAAYLPMTDGSGDTVFEDVSNTYHRIVGARWCPRITIDTRYSSVGAGRVAQRREMKPAHQVEARWRRNHRPLLGEDLAPIVASTVDGQAQRREYLSARRINDQRADYPDSRSIELDTALGRETDAIRCAAFLADRFAPGRTSYDLDEVRRQILALQLTDEIHLYDPRFEASGRALRAVQIQAALETMKGKVGAWG